MLAIREELIWRPKKLHKLHSKGSQSEILDDTSRGGNLGELIVNAFNVRPRIFRTHPTI